MAMRARTPPLTEDRGFWTIFGAAAAIAITSAVLPPLVGSVDASWNLRVSYWCTAVWFVFQIAAVVRHRWRGLGLLIGLPIVLFWPIAFQLLEYACRHDKNACL
jgi:hypothetical protein